MGLIRNRALKLTLAVIAVLAVIYCAASVYIAYHSLSAEATAFQVYPAELGLDYEEVEFSPRGWPELRLRG